MITEKTLEFSVPSRISAVDEAVSRVLAFAGDIGFGEEYAFALDLAVREAVANAAKHGNLLDESKDVEISLTATDEALEVSIRDVGEGFSIDDVPDPTDPENVLKTSGRGLLFIRNFMDHAEWKSRPEGGTEVLMRKNR